MAARARIYGGKDPRDLAAYSVPTAARILRIPTKTLRNWVTGEGPRVRSPIIVAPTPAPGESHALSFTNLVEAHVLVAIRRVHLISLQNLRKAVRYVEKELGTSHPLAREKFATDGVHLFVDRINGLINVSRAGQLAIRDAMEVGLHRIDWDSHGMAQRLFPLTRLEAGDQPRFVMIDPHRAFGRPVLVGTGLAVDVIAQRFRAGESVEHLADDYAITNEMVQEALRAAA
jgi:uncharacterized protein (DUF433 family)